MFTFKNLKGFFDGVCNADTVGQLKQMRQVIDEKIVIMERKENVAKDQTNLTDSTILEFELSKKQLDAGLIKAMTLAKNVNDRKITLIEAVQQIHDSLND